MSEKTGATHIVADKGHPMRWVLPEGAISRFGRGSVMAMAVSPDGTYLAAATKIGLWWYELATMQPVALWERERGMLGAITISLDGRLAATGNWDGVIKVWDIHQNYDGTARMSVCYSQKGVLHTLENALGKNTVVVWDVERRQDTHCLKARACAS